jgi:GNAT superfamily N-acetyltransferase
MLARMPAPPRLDVHPLTASRFTDLEALFNGPGGSQVRGCWCMFYRRSGTAAIPKGMSRGEHARSSLKALVEQGCVPGLLGYRGGEPVAWLSLGPREQFARLARSPVMKPVDDKPVWSVVCFYTAKRLRGRGLAAQMLKAGIDFARGCGARLLEAYPVDRRHPCRDDAMWFGCKAMYDRAGFVEVARRKPTRVVVRKALRAKRA